MLPFIAAAAVVVSPLAAQQRLPDSYQGRLATLDRLERLTPGDIRELTSKEN
jgi:hypothetical protein